MRTVVAVLRGGPSSEYEVSLKSGAAVLEHLDREKYEPRDIFITRKGEWHSHGVPMLPEKALAGVDVVFNALHGEFGEDGGVQRLLHVLKIPYTGPEPVAAALTFNKARTNTKAAQLGIKVPHSVTVSKPADLESTALKIFRSFPHPAVVKPVTGGSSVGITVAENFHALLRGLEAALAVAPKALVEEYIAGKPVSVGVIEQFRNDPLYATFPLPGSFTREEKERLTALAKAAHEGLGLSHYSQSDFVVSRRGIYFLEVNSLPKLHKNSFMHQAIDAIGAKLSGFFDHLISLAKNYERAH
jgi:D-alanine-D-alanine ligase